MERIRACVVGATGFAGIEVCRLVLGHPNMELVMVTDRKEAGTRLDAVYPSFAGACDLELSLPEPDAIAQAADVAFLAVPHTASLALTPELLRRGVTVLEAHAPEDAAGCELAAGIRPGEVRFAGKRLFLGMADSALEVGALKPDGKQTMDARSFAAGVQGIKDGGLTWEEPHA